MSRAPSANPMRAAMQAVLLVAFLAWWLHGFAQLATEPLPHLLRYEDRAEPLTPEGEVLDQPAGTEVLVCQDAGGVVLRYRLSTRTFSVPRPCVQALLFRHGFEG